MNKLHSISFLNVVYPNSGHMHLCVIVWFLNHISSVFLLHGTAMTLRMYKTR